jgi:hypothetical protein
MPESATHWASRTTTASGASGRPMRRSACKGKVRRVSSTQPDSPSRALPTS